MNPIQFRLNRSGLRQRQGAAVVEFAVCMPIILLLVLGSIEATSMIFLKQSLNTASYEGTREVIRTSADAAEATQRAEAILYARFVNDFTITFPLGDPASRNRGELIAMEVSAPSQSNSPLAGRFLANRVLTVRTVMVKE